MGSGWNLSIVEGLITMAFKTSLEGLITVAKTPNMTRSKTDRRGDLFFGSINNNELLS